MKTQITTLLLAILCLASPTPSASAAETPAPSADRTEWQRGAALWTDTAHWSAGLPNGFERAIISGDTTVTLPSGTYLAGDLELGFNAGDHSRAIIDGGQLILMQDSLRVGEYTGGTAEFILKDGAMHSIMDVFLGAASSLPKRANNSTIRIQGGSFLGRTLTIGLGWGAQSLLSIEGSRPSAIHALDFVEIAAIADPTGRPGLSTLSFTLDDRGVTPITIQSKRRGLRINQDDKSHSRLQISLSAVPPREDVTLVSANVPVEGTFENLPEGSTITAEFNGQTYRWILTYHGGPRHNDLVLKNISEYAAGAPVTHVREIPSTPKPLWLEHPLYPLAIPTGVPAFNGAEGYGAFTPAGRGGKTIDITSLDDAGPGTLREAINADGPRTLRFLVGGVIALKSALTINHPFLTFDAQSAPAPGILIRDHGLQIQTHDVLLRYFRIRIGDDAARRGAKTISEYQGADGEDALRITDASTNIIADHLSLSWATSKLLTITKMSDLITIQNCILSESLNFAGHGYASLSGGNRITFHHNLFAHNLSRNVRFQGGIDADFRNNVIYDWGEKAAYGEFDRVNYVGNYLKPGRSTIQKPQLFHDGAALANPASLFVADNLIEGEPKVAANNWRGMGYYYERDTVAAPQPFPAPPVSTESAPAAFDHVLQNAGATLPARDPVDTRIVKEVRDGTGHIINWVADTPGWPDFSTSTVPAP